MNWKLLLLVLLSFPVLVLGQGRRNPSVFQISGLVLSENSGEPLSYVRVQVNHTRQGTYTNPDGFFSLPVALGDTLFFSRLGNYRSKLIIYDYYQQYKGDKNYMFVIHYMLEDTMTLPEVTIIPYSTPEQLRTAVVNMDVLKDTPQDYAEQNLDPERMHAIIESLPIDEAERVAIGRQMYYDYYKSREIMNTVSVDALALTRFLQKVADKSKKKGKNLNYWEE